MPQKKSKLIKVTPYRELGLCLFSTNYYRFCNILLKFFTSIPASSRSRPGLNCQAGGILWTWPLVMRDRGAQPQSNYSILQIYYTYRFKAAM